MYAKKLMAIFVKKTMNRILRFGEFSKIDSAIFRLKNAEKTDDEIICSRIKSNILLYYL